MSQFQQNVELIRTESMTRDVVRLTFHAPDIAATAHPGQFIMVQTTTTGNDPLLRRPFSIHQVNNNGALQILFKVLGRGTELLAKRQEGEFVSLLGPLGKGFTLDNGDASCLIGGGMGIAPMLFLAHSLRRQGKTPTVILGARTGDELVPLLADFKQLGVVVQAVTNDGSFGSHGFVTDIFKDIHFPAHSINPIVYTCGPRPMMAAIFLQCQHKNLSCQVSMETTMACGIGACLGCAIPLKSGGYAHVCADGPVFSAKDLLWNL